MINVFIKIYLVSLKSILKNFDYFLGIENTKCLIIMQSK